MRIVHVLLLVGCSARPPAVADSGQVSDYQKQRDGVTITLAHGSLRLQALAPRVIRVRFSAKGLAGESGIGGENLGEFG